MPTSEPSSVELGTSANACDDAAAAAWDNIEAVRFVDVDAAAVAAAGDRPRTSLKGVIRGSGNGVDASSGETADGALVGIAECGFAVVKTLNNPLFEFLRKCGQYLPASSADTERPKHKYRIMQDITWGICQSIEQLKRSWRLCLAAFSSRL